MATVMSRPFGDVQQQFRSLQVLVDHISSQELFLQILDREDSISDLGKRLAREGVTGELVSNRRLFLDFFYNLIAASGEKERELDVEFTYVTIGADILEVDRCILWYEDLELKMPFEIGEKFGRTILGESLVDVVNRIISFYKEAEARFDRQFSGNLERCSLLVLQEHYPQAAYHITMRLPAVILNDYPVTL
ncbi:MAG TPA: hypothetical protein VN372_08165 [Methanospirillum sp.]|nr:hypothetical protein [Methanospirillum sp.]